MDDHLYHLRRDSGGSPWGIYTSPGNPANPATPARTPGPTGQGDAAAAFFAAAGRSVADPLDEAVRAARSLGEARREFAGRLSVALSGVLGTDFDLTLPSLNTVEATPWNGQYPGWFPLEQWDSMYRAAKAWDSALSGIDESAHTESAKTAGFAGTLTGLYTVGDRGRQLEVDFTHIDARLPLPQLIKAFRTEAFDTAARQLLTKANQFEGFRSQLTVEELIDAITYFDALSPEWRPAVDARYQKVERLLEWVDAWAPPLTCLKTQAGALILPHQPR